MEEARQSIKEKLRQIQIEQESKERGISGGHDPKDYDFTQHHRINMGEGQQTYYYNKTIKFPQAEDGKIAGIPIFQMNTDIYKTANMVDGLVGTLLFYSSYKVLKQFYILTFGAGLAGFSFTSTLIWSILVAAQTNYLT